MIVESMCRQTHCTLTEFCATFRAAEMAPSERHLTYGEGGLSTKAQVCTSLQPGFWTLYKIYGVFVKSVLPCPHICMARILPSPHFKTINFHEWTRLVCSLSLRQQGTHLLFMRDLICRPSSPASKDHPSHSWLAQSRRPYGVFNLQLQPSWRRGCGCRGKAPFHVLSRYYCSFENWLHHMRLKNVVRAVYSEAGWSSSAEYLQ